MLPAINEAMKKYHPDKKRRRYIKRRLVRLELHELKRKENRRGHAIMSSRPSKSLKSSKSKDINRKDYKKIITLPQNFSLSDNYRETIAKINEIRNIGKKGGVYVDFDNIKKIGVAAALVLVSEFEVANIKEKKGTRWARALDNNWNREVRRLLHDMGFYELLDLRRDSKDRGRNNPDEEFLKFHSGKANIQDAGKILSDISDEISKFAAGNLPHLMVLKASISEAVLNTRYHAYGDIEKHEEFARWWISASLSKSGDEIKVICYDRGRSIPKTLPSNYRDWLRTVKSIAEFDPIYDALLIKAAMEENRTSSPQKGRGNGLPELIEVIAHSNEGKLMVFSRNGKVTYSKSSSGETRWNPEGLPVPIKGTLIIWSIITKARKTS